MLNYWTRHDFFWQDGADARDGCRHPTPRRRAGSVYCVFAYCRLVRNEPDFSRGRAEAGEAIWDIHCRMRLYRLLPLQRSGPLSMSTPACTARPSRRNSHPLQCLTAIGWGAVELSIPGLACSIEPIVSPFADRAFAAFPPPPPVPSRVGCSASLMGPDGGSS